MRIEAEDIACGFDAALGLLDGFEVRDEGRTVAPLHRAPWVGTGEAMPPGTPPHLARLGGDFFCAPFAASDDGSPMHGWPPNAPWEIAENGPGWVRATLTRPAMGATVTKELRLRDGHPFVYQRHAIAGGEGTLPVANHANVSVRGGALIRCSPKARWQTPATPQESDPARGRSALRYPAQGEDAAAFPGQDGPIDLSRYPWAPRHEDFVVGIEASGHALGWTAVTRPEAGDLFLSLRDARALPMTMLWHSNGGRDYPPWSGRHRDCLGVEEGAAAYLLGASGDADLSGPGALALGPGARHEIRHVLGAIHWPSGEPVAALTLVDDELRISGERGASRHVPVWTAGLFGDGDAAQGRDR